METQRVGEAYKLLTNYSERQQLGYQPLHTANTTRLATV